MTSDSLQLAAFGVRVVWQFYVLYKLKILGYRCHLLRCVFFFSALFLSIPFRQKHKHSATLPCPRRDLAAKASLSANFLRIYIPLGARKTNKHKHQSHRIGAYSNNDGQQQLIQHGSEFRAQQQQQHFRG